MSRPFNDSADTAQHEVAKQRDKAVKAAMRRKEEFLGARVPKELRKRVIARANELGIPVSILIRNILEDAFAEQEKTNTAPQAPFNDVIGWENIVLNRSLSCSACGRPMVKGQPAHFGIGASSTTVLCKTCMGSQ